MPARQLEVAEVVVEQFGFEKHNVSFAALVVGVAAPALRPGDLRAAAMETGMGGQVRANWLVTA